MWSEVNYTEPKACNVTDSLPGHSMMDFHSHSKSRQVLSGFLAVEDSQNPTFRGMTFDSILFLTIIRKKTMIMMLRSLRKPNYQFWSSGTAFFLSCHSPMATWLHVTFLRVTRVERDFRTHECIGFFFFFCAADKCLQHQKRYSKRSHFSTKQFITMDSCLQESRTDEV